jgi:phosphatidylglycerol---prolipoprotein diacylglyceryl transferase
MTEHFNRHKKSYLLYGGIILGFLFVLSLAILVQDGTPYKPTALALSLFGIDLEIQWYAVFILTGISLGAVLAYNEFKHLGLDPEVLYDALLWTVPLAIVGARLYYVIFDPTPSYDSLMDVINLTRGGLSIHGAVIATVIVLLVFSRIRKVSFWLLTDVAAPGFLIGQIVGRWGNFMNQEAYGPVIESQFWIDAMPAFIRNQMFIDGVYRTPTFLLEGMWNLVGLVILLVIRRKRLLKPGGLIGAYLIWYGLGRGAIIEPLRTQGAVGDALRIFGAPVNVYLSLTLFMLGGVAIVLLKSVFSKKDEPFYAEIGQTPTQETPNED